MRRLSADAVCDDAIILPRGMDALLAVGAEISVAHPVIGAVRRNQRGQTSLPLRERLSTRPRPEHSSLHTESRLQTGGG